MGVTVIGFILNWLAKFRLSYFIQRPAYMIAAFALLLLIVLTSMVLLQRTSAERDRLVTTVETDGALYELLLALRRVESPQRGYLLTGNDDFLSAYRQAVPAVASSIEAIRQGVEGDREQSRRIEVLKPLIEQKLAIALKVSARVCVMGHGRVVFEGTPQELAADKRLLADWLAV